MPPVPHGAAGAGRQVGGSEDGRARRAWVDSVGALSVTLATPLNGKEGEGLRIWPPPGGHCAGGGARRRPCLLEEKRGPGQPLRGGEAGRPQCASPVDVWVRCRR